jgi:hypothetical protein
MDQRAGDLPARHRRSGDHRRTRARLQGAGGARVQKPSSARSEGVRREAGWSTG